MVESDLIQSSIEFLSFLDKWINNLSPCSAADVFSCPEQTAVIVVDMTDGFCKHGTLASSRVGGLISPVVNFLETAHRAGVRHFLLPQDTHHNDALEFSAFPPHCVAGTSESETVVEIKALPFYSDMVILPKNSVNSAAAEGLQNWMSNHPEIGTFVVVGDCTDICIYQMALALQTQANEMHLPRRVVVPASEVQTYDRSVETARIQGGLPHAGDLLHAVFLYHMALNGVEVVKKIE